MAKKRSQSLPVKYFKVNDFKDIFFTQAASIEHMIGCSYSVSCSIQFFLSLAIANEPLKIQTASVPTEKLLFRTDGV